MMKDSFDINKVRRDMMELWKKTFHDSTRYIDIVFDAYFQPENAFTYYDGEKLVAALLGVEYRFQTKEEGGKKDILKGLYLCGLATLPTYRRRGIMAQLMKEAEKSANARGFDLTFLIPADNHLREYYEKKGYITESFLIRQPLEEISCRTPYEMYIYTFQELSEMGKCDFIGEVAEWCSEHEKECKNTTTILHSPADFTAIITENENSIFFTDCTFDLENPILAKVRAVVFPSPSDDEKSNVWKISGVFIQDDYRKESKGTRKKLIPESILTSLRIKYPDREFKLNVPFCGEESEIANKVPYAMIKNLGKAEKFMRKDTSLFKIYLMLD